MKMTYHCEVQRANRVSHIINEIGIGQVVIEKYNRTPAQIREGRPGAYTCVTDTGITIIKAENKDTIITMYVTTYRELVALCGSPKKIPSYLRKKVDRNQTFFTQNGKTIWKQASRLFRRRENEIRKFLFFY